MAGEGSVEQSCHWHWVTSALAWSREVWERLVEEVPSKEGQGAPRGSSPHGRVRLCSTADVFIEGFAEMLRVKMFYMIK